MMSFDNDGIRVSISLVYLLQQTLHGIIDRALEAQQEQEEEDSLRFQSLLFPESISVRHYQVQVEHEEEEYGCWSGIQQENTEQVSKGGFQSLEPCVVHGQVRQLSTM